MIVKKTMGMELLTKQSFANYSLNKQLFADITDVFMTLSNIYDGALSRKWLATFSR